MDKSKINQEDYYSYMKKHFSRLAPFYDAIDIFIYRIRDQVVDITDANKGSKILDVATGTGKQAFAFAKKGFDVEGIDLSEEMLKVANRKNKFRNVRFKVADATDIPFKNNYFDISCISFALHETPSEIRKKILKEMVRVTKREGTIVIVDYSLPKNKIGKHLIYYFCKLYEIKYYQEFIKSDLESLLKKLGLKIEKELPILLGAGKIIRGILWNKI